MSTRDSELEADSLDMLVIEPSPAAFAFTALRPLAACEDERILEADEIAAELVDSFEVRFLPPTPAQRRISAAARSAAPAMGGSSPALAATPVSRVHSEITVAGSALPLQPLAASAAELSAVREELARLQTQMRARDD